MASRSCCEQANNADHGERCTPDKEGWDGAPPDAGHVFKKNDPYGGGDAEGDAQQAE